MRKIFTLALLCTCFTFGLKAQVLVSTDPMLKNAILEEFTGIHCTYCPDGHAIAASIMESNPGRVFTIAIHQGSFASPYAGEPDYRTIFGDPIANQTGLTGYPSGTVNRHLFSGAATALNRGSWAAACSEIIAQTSPMNVGISSQFDEATRLLTVQVELYYTSDAPTSSNFINVALIQDSIYGPQTGGGAGSNYRHMHMLRYMVTGQWGDQVTTTTAGSLVTRTYTYTVPAAYNNIPAVVENMKVVAFVTKDHQEIYTGDEVDAIGGTNMYIGKITSEEAYIQPSVSGYQRIFNVEANSNIAGTEPFELWLENENAPADWQASYEIDGLEYTGSTTIDLTKDVAKQITVKVTPGLTAGFPGYVLKMKSVNNPTAPEKTFKVMVVSGVTDLLVNGTGGPQSSDNQDAYLDGFDAAGISSYAVVDANVMRDMINAHAYEGVLACWLNIAWTFPALTDSQAEAVMDYMDAGHNIFIAGQDIGWDIMSGATGSNGNAITRNFFTNYLKAGFVDDGSSTNNKLNANAADPIYGAVPQSTIVDVYAGNMYPDVITAQTGADVIFNYTVATKNAAVKYDGIWRSVYFGVGLEMLSNVAVRNQIISLTRQWLSAEMVGVEYNEAVSALMSGQNYPNPATTYTYIPVSKDANGGQLEIYNMNGTRVISQAIGSELLYKINLNNLPAGIYTYRVVNGDKVSETHKMSLVK
ncbi:MAG: Omp28-related outer membrane protein [Omnitrophica WOR_2 bacterium]